MTEDAGKMTAQHHETMFRRLLDHGVVTVVCENMEDHNKEPYARFYWRVRDSLLDLGFRTHSTLVGDRHRITIIPTDAVKEQMLQRFADLNDDKE